MTKVMVTSLQDAATTLETLLAGKQAMVVTEPRVWALHGSKLPFANHPLFVPEGEDAKQWPHLIGLVDELASRQIDRSTPIVAFGGGAVGDLAGLAASLFKRGCPVIQIPTTLLAQADSALGGKTAIDAAGQKNLVGTFHQPILLVADVALLATLDQRQLRAGYAEIVKYGLIADADFFRWCETNAAALLAGDEGLRNTAISFALKTKAGLVAGDVEDRGGQRALLNLGHSFGHAIEAVSGIGTLLHGEAVALGTVLAAQFSRLDEIGRIADHFASVGLPTTLADVGLGGAADRIFDLMRGDKKNESGEIRLILLDEIGRAAMRPVDPSDLRAFLRQAG